MSEVKKTLIQLRREAKGLSRAQFAAKLGITGGYVKVVEKMKVTPSAELLENVGKELGIPYERLVAEYRKTGGAPAAPPSRQRRGRPSKKEAARKPRFSNAPATTARPLDGGSVTPLFAAPLAEQDELVTIALRAQQGVEMVLRAVNERQQGRDASARALVRKFQQTLAELVALTARVAVSEAERRAGEEEMTATGDPFRPAPNSPT